MEKTDMIKKINNAELELLKGKRSSLFQNDDMCIFKELILNIPKELENLDYEAILNSSCLNFIFEKIEFKNSQTLNENLRKLESCIKQTVTSRTLFDVEICILLVGVCALQEFLKRNWSGPCLTDSSFTDIKSFLSISEDQQVFELLVRNGEPPYENVKNPELLLLSDIILSSLDGSCCVTSKWWRFRLLMLHQHILLGKSTIIYNELSSLSVDLLETKWINENEAEKVQLLTEISLMHLYYQEVMHVEKLICKAQIITGLEIDLSGKLGMRTQFQEKPVAQLVVKLKRNPSVPECNNDMELEDDDALHDLLLEDDVLLNKVKFLNVSDDVHPRLRPEEQLVLLFQCCRLQNSSAIDELLKEKLMAYIDCILEQKTVWSIQFKALFMRCRFEKSQTRKIDRVIKQLEVLQKAFKNQKPDVFHRQYLFYSTFYPSVWVLEKELADVLISLGAVKSALEIYERLKLWEDIVKCYIILGRNKDAATMISEKLKTNETPYLWCLLGDVTHDISCYEKAWELSNHKSARSQNSLGYFYYEKRDYKNSLPYFMKSVEINHLQPRVWFSLAFAATAVQDYERAAQAYRHVVSFDSENFEAWNNLSNAYIKLEQKERAHRTLQEALKCNYENWRVWENYLLVCVDVGSFEEAIQACHRLLDIKGKFDDAEVLGIIAKAINKDLPDYAGQPSSRLKKKALELFGRITSVVFDNGDIWKIYSTLYASESDCLNNPQKLELVIRYVQKSLKCATQMPRWEKDVHFCRKIVNDCFHLVGMYCRYAKIADESMKPQFEASINLLLKCIVVRIERNMKDFKSEESDELKSMLRSLSDKFGDINMA